MASETAKPAKKSLQDSDIRTFSRNASPAAASAGTDVDTHAETDSDAHSDTDVEATDHDTAPAAASDSDT